MQKYLAVFLASAFALPPLPVMAELVPAPATAGGGGGMTTSASNAVLPTARIGLGIEDASASYYNLGSGLFGSYATKIDATATTTNTSPTITVASGANIAVGDSIWAAFVPNGAYVSAIAGTTVTMSQNATATGSGTAVTFGQSRFVAGNTTLTDALGAKVGYFGSASQGRSTWLNRYFIGSDFLTNQSLLSISPYGSYAGIFAARSSDQTGGAGAYVIPLAVHVLQDGTGTAHSSQGLYIQADLLSTSTPAQHINNENSVQNGWTASADSDPYTPNPARSVFNLRLDNGKGAGASNTATAAIDIINNGGNYLAGIIIGSDALDTSAGRIAPALAMATNHSLDWYSGAGNKAWRQYSTKTSGNGTINLTAGGATMTVPLATLTLTDPNNSRSALLGVTDGFNTILDSVGGSVILKAGGTTMVTLGGLAGTTFTNGFAAFAGTTSSFPALKRVGTGLEAKLADDSDYATLVGKVKTVSKTANYTVTAADIETHFNNTGAAGEVDFTLPAAAAGLNYCFLVDAAQIVKVIAASGEKIAIGASNSAATGNITANAVFAMACIEAHKTGQWAARSSTGTWTVN